MSVIFSLLICLLFPATLWLFSFQDYPVSHSHHGRGGFVRLIFLLPVYFRLPLVACVIVGVTCGMIAYLVRLGDRRSDFLFGPDGVAHIGLFVSKSLLWNDIGRLNLVHHQRRFLFSKKPIHQFHTAEFVCKSGHSIKVRARSKLAALLSIVQTGWIVVELGPFGMSPADFEETMLFLHPKLEITREDRVRWNRFRPRAIAPPWGRRKRGAT